MSIQFAKKINIAEAGNAKGLVAVERKYRVHPENEIIPFAINTPFLELAETVCPDHDGAWAHPLILFESEHVTTIGAAVLSRKTKNFLDSLQDAYPMDVLSISSGMSNDKLSVVGLIRVYGDSKPPLYQLYDFLGENTKHPEEHRNRVVEETYPVKRFTEAEIASHAASVKRQQEALEGVSADRPLLNMLGEYVTTELDPDEGRRPLVYDLLTKDMQISTILEYRDFIRIFEQCMSYITGVERDLYYNVMRGKVEKSDFFTVVDAYIEKNFIETHELPIEDLPAMKNKLNRALFELYIVQDLIDDPEITDIKITAMDSIRVRVKGKAYMSNVTFIDEDDYERFIVGIAVKNRIDLSVPTQTFTDDHDENYILRFTITAPYITGSGVPIIHIRKVSRVKMMDDDLIKAGMFDAKIRNYLVDCAKFSRGVVFAGAPGSGKTILLNWFLEQYEDSAEILVIQENDELFAYRKGVMFEHVVTNPTNGELPCSREDLGQIALVAGANVFVIGEVKGAEICSAITLSNSGCRTALTIHSQSSTETVDKMADLAMRGYATSYEQAKRMIKSFQTIVYLENFKVQEISEIVGFNEATKNPVYRMIYRRDLEAQQA